jgi:L-ascorbate metabolism protein UlaG (beta-lactamase superfamily)
VRLTKLGHACVRLAKNDANLVIDPGVWSEGALDGASAVLITHEHPDHLDTEAVLAALAADGGLGVWANEAVARHLTAAAAGQVHVVQGGDAFDVAGFSVHAYGHEHAVIHPSVPVIPNTGFAVDGAVFHPGDALTIPEDRVPVLMLPINAPWLKVSEMIDYARAAGPSRAYAIHDGLLNDKGLGLMANLLRVAQPDGAEYARLEPGTSVDL